MIRWLLCKWFNLYTKEDVDWIRQHWFMIGWDCGANRNAPDKITINTDK